MWLPILRALAVFVGIFAKYMVDKQHLKIDEYKEIALSHEDLLEKINLAHSARHSVKHDDDSVRMDKYNRRNKKDDRT